MESPRQISRVTLLNIILVLEGALLLCATIWSMLAQIPLAPALKLNAMQAMLGTASGIALATVSNLMFWLGKFPSFKLLYGLRDLVLKELAPAFADITWSDIILLSLASGFCEEVLFRGVLQNQFGLFGASVLFGIVHCPSLKYPHYGIWALIAGLGLGYLYQSTGSLWTPIIAHVVNNILGLFVLKTIGRRLLASKAQ